MKERPTEELRMDYEDRLEDADELKRLVWREDELVTELKRNRKSIAYLRRRCGQIDDGDTFSSFRQDTSGWDNAQFEREIAYLFEYIERHRPYARHMSARCDGYQAQVETQRAEIRALEAQLGMK